MPARSQGDATDTSPTRMLDGNVAHIQLDTAVNLRRRVKDLVVVGVTGIVIEVRHAEANPQGQPTDFASSLCELHAAYEVCNQLRALPVPVCAVLSGDVSALGLAVSLSADHRIGIDGLAIDFTSRDVATLVFDVTDALTAAVGHAKADSIRFERPAMGAAEASERRILHSACVDTTAAMEFAVVYVREGRRLNKSVLPRCD
jgi:enoyl-CoA hydratase/carnithine racemase